MKNEDGISELVDETLLIALVVICAGIAGVLLLGFAIPVDKTAYLVPQFGLADIGGKSLISVYDRGGDPVYFNATPLAKYRAAFYVDTSLGTYLAYPDPTLEVMKPGDKVYLYYTGNTFIATKNLPGSSLATLPSGGIAVRIVDVTSRVLIAGETLVQGPVIIGTPTPTATATINVTPTATMTTITSTPTANVTATGTPTPTATSNLTPTATTPASTRTITVRWSPNGLWYGSVSPPAKLTNGQEVIVPRGSSKTIYFTPNANKNVLTLKLDGTTVYTGSSVGSTISYTITNILEDKQLTATFG